MWSQNQFLWQQQQWAAAAAASASAQATQPPTAALGASQGSQLGLPSTAPVPVSQQSDPPNTDPSDWAAKASQWAQHRQAQEQYMLWQQQQQQLLALQQQQQQLATLQSQQQQYAAFQQQQQQQQPPLPPPLQQEQQEQEQQRERQQQHQGVMHQQEKATPLQVQIPKLPMQPSPQLHFQSQEQVVQQQSLHPFARIQSQPFSPRHPQPRNIPSAPLPTARPEFESSCGLVHNIHSNPVKPVHHDPAPPRFAHQGQVGQQFRPPFHSRLPPDPYKPVHNPDFSGPRGIPAHHAKFRGPPPPSGAGFHPHCQPLMWRPRSHHSHSHPHHPYAGDMPPTEAMFREDSYVLEDDYDPMEEYVSGEDYTPGEDGTDQFYSGDQSFPQTGDQPFPERGDQPVLETGNATLGENINRPLPGSGNQSFLKTGSQQSPRMDSQIFPEGDLKDEKVSDAANRLLREDSSKSFPAESSINQERSTPQPLLQPTLPSDSKPMEDHDDSAATSLPHADTTYSLSSDSDKPALLPQPLFYAAATADIAAGVTNTTKPSRSSFIPGLDLANAPLKAEDVSLTEQTSGQSSNQVMASLGKIVSQLQSLKGLTSSLKLLGELPGVKEKREEIEQDEATKRKVAALLNDESDSDGEQVQEPQTKAGQTDSRQDPTDPSPPVRDFDGFSINSNVYDIYNKGPPYSEQASYPGGYNAPQVDAEKRQDYGHSQESLDWEREPHHQHDHDNSHRDRDLDQQQSWSHYYQNSKNGDRYRRQEHRHPPPDLRGDRGPLLRHMLPHSPPLRHHHHPHSPPPRHPPSRSPPSRCPPPPRCPPSRSPPPRRHHPHSSPPYSHLSPSPHWEDYQTRHPQHSLPVRRVDVYEKEYAARERRDYHHPLPPAHTSHLHVRLPPPPPAYSEHVEQQVIPPPAGESEYGQTSSILSAIESVDYNHGQTAQESYHDPVPAPPQQPHDCPPYNMYEAPPLNEQTFPSHLTEQLFNQYQQDFQSGVSTDTFLPALLGENRKRGLPLWIREQLEKLEQQKVKELERETEAARQAEYTNLSSWRDELDEEEKETSGDKQIKRIRGLSPPLHHRQPNYRTHRDDDEDDEISDGSRRSRQSSQCVVQAPATSDDDDEKHLHLISKVRRMLTEVLLDVTTSEMKKLSKEAMDEAKKSKRTFSEQVSHKDSTCKNLLGLSIYSSESDTEKEVAFNPDDIAAAFRGSSVSAKYSVKDTKRKSKSHSKDKDRSSKWDSRSREKKKKDNEPSKMSEDVPKHVQDEELMAAFMKKVETARVVKEVNKMEPKEEEQKAIPVDTKWRPFGGDPIKFTICQSDSVTRVASIQKPAQPPLPPGLHLTPFQKAISQATKGFRSRSRSPPQRSRSPPQRSRSPPQRSHSPPQRNHSPHQRNFSPLHPNRFTIQRDQPLRNHSPPQWAHLPPHQSHSSPQQMHSPLQRIGSTTSNSSSANKRSHSTSHGSHRHSHHHHHSHSRSRSRSPHGGRSHSSFSRDRHRR